jgi:hypothetical protein
MGPHTYTTQQEERAITMGYTSAHMGPHTYTTQQEERAITMGYTSAHTQHNRKNEPSLWGILAHRWDRIQKDLAHDNRSTAVFTKRQHLMMARGRNM